MTLVMDVCETIHVLDFGRMIAVGPARRGPRRPGRGRGLPRHAEGVGDDRRQRRDDPGHGGAPDVHIETEVPLLELIGVRAAYGRIEVLHGVDLAVHGGEVVALLGPNGAGKSTTLKVAAGLLRPTAGAVRVAGPRRQRRAQPTSWPASACARSPRDGACSPTSPCARTCGWRRRSPASATALEDAAFDRFPRLAERRTQLAGTLSGGEQQMLAMSRALATDPALLLLDELSMGLAPIIVQQLYEIVAQVAAEGVSILVVEQFAQTVLGIADRAAIMVNGDITRVGTPAELQSELSSAYLGGARSTP